MSKKIALNIGALVVAILLAILWLNTIGLAASDACQVNIDVGPEWNHTWQQLVCDPEKVSEEWAHVDFGFPPPYNTTDVWVHADGVSDAYEVWYPHPGGNFTVTAKRLSNGEVLGSKTLNLLPFTETPEPTLTASPTLTPTPTATAEPKPNCKIGQEEGDIVNHIFFVFSCENFAAWGTIDFGDETGTDVWFENGLSKTDHAYDYEVGGKTIYNASLSVAEGKFVFPFQVVIDDRPFKHTIFLPLVVRH